MQQGWPKLAANVLLRKGGAADGAPPTIAVAMLAPVEATVAWRDATAGAMRSTRVKVVTDYPFGDNATLDVRVPEGHTTTAHVRIPGWAVGATVNGAPAPNGTLVPIVCAAGSTRVHVSLPASIRVERGWGAHGQLAQAPIVYGDGENGGGVRAAAEAGLSLIHI